MLKFLRKYNKFILVVFGSILMVAFLVPQAIQQFGQHPDGFVQARMDGVALRDRQMELAARELMAVRILGFSGNFGIADNEDAEGHWLMLVEEAERAGLIGESADGETWLPSLRQQILFQLVNNNMQLLQLLQQNPQFAAQYQQQVETVIAQAMQEARLSEDDFYMTLAKVRGVDRLLGAFQNAARLSAKRAAIETKEVGDRALADLLVIPAGVLVDELPEPNEEELAAHFEKYRDVAPAQGEHVGVGYLLPPRVKFEVIKIDDEAIKSNVQLDPVEVRTYFQRNTDRFGEDFAAARAQVEDELAGRVAQDVQQTALRVLRTEVYRATQSLPEVGGVRALPSNWSEIRPTFENLAGQIVEEVEASIEGEFEMPRPEVMVYASKFHTIEDLNEIAELRQAQISVGNRSVPFVQAFFAVHELSPDSPLDVQVGVPALGLVGTDRAGARYYFTVLEARDESPAESLSEVREKAVRDFKRLAAYQMLQIRESEFLDLARSSDLQSVADLFAPEDPEQGADAAGAPVVRERALIGASNPQFGQQYAQDEETLRERVVEAATAISPTTPLDEYPVEQSTLAVPLPQQTAMALVRIVQNQPLTVERLRVQLQQAAMRSMFDELVEAGARETNPYSFDALSDRLNWEYVRRQARTESTEGDGEETETEGAE